MPNSVPVGVYYNIVRVAPVSVENASHLTVKVCCGPTVKEKSRTYAMGVPLLLLLKIKTDQGPETKFAFSMGLRRPELG